jgi:hypothetical protein
VSVAVTTLSIGLRDHVHLGQRSDVARHALAGHERPVAEGLVDVELAGAIGDSLISVACSHAARNSVAISLVPLSDRLRKQHTAQDLATRCSWHPCAMSDARSPRAQRGGARNALIQELVDERRQFRAVDLLAKGGRVAAALSARTRFLVACSTASSSLAAANWAWALGLPADGPAPPSLSAGGRALRARVTFVLAGVSTSFKPLNSSCIASRTQLTSTSVRSASSLLQAWHTQAQNATLHVCVCFVQAPSHFTDKSPP